MKNIICIQKIDFLINSLNKKKGTDKMKKHIRFITLLILFLICIAMLTGCGEDAVRKEHPASDSTGGGGDIVQKEPPVSDPTDETQKEPPVSNFTYEAGEGGIIITGYNGHDAKVSIPSVIDDKKVTKLNTDVFSGSLSLEEIHLSKYMELNPICFMNCENLKSIYAPGATEIPACFAEYNLNSLEVLSLPSVKKFTNDYFYWWANTPVNVIDLSGVTEIKDAYKSWPSGITNSEKRVKTVIFSEELYDSLLADADRLDSFYNDDKYLSSPDDIKLSCYAEYPLKAEQIKVGDKVYSAMEWWKYGKN